MTWQPPQFPDGTRLFIKEFDVPLAQVPGEGWFNWFGGRPRAYDVTGLQPGNHWPAESLQAWLMVVTDGGPAKTSEERSESRSTLRVVNEHPSLFLTQ